VSECVCICAYVCVWHDLFAYRTIIVPVDTMNDLRHSMQASCLIVKRSSHTSKRSINHECGNAAIKRVMFSV